MNATLEYKKNAVMTASPEKLVMLMFDGAVSYVRQARHKLSVGDAAGCGDMIGKAFNVVSELKVSLDFEAGGEAGRAIAVDLERLYAFIMDRLVSANAAREVAHLDHAESVLTTLREGWQGAISG